MLIYSSSFSTVSRDRSPGNSQKVHLYEKGYKSGSFSAMWVTLEILNEKFCLSKTCLDLHFFGNVNHRSTIAIVLPFFTIGIRSPQTDEISVFLHHLKTVGRFAPPACDRPDCPFKTSSIDRILGKVISPCPLPGVGRISSSDRIRGLACARIWFGECE